MSRAFIRQINVGLGVTLLLLLLNALVSYRNISRLISNERQVSQSYQTIAALEAALSTLKDAETGQRGYLLTGRDRYLEPYNTAIAQTNQQIQRLQQQVSPALQPQIETLSQLVDTKLAELDRTIQIRRSGGLNAALREVETDRGKQIMDEIRQQVAAIEQVERQQLSQRQQESQRSIQSTLLTFTGVTGVSLLLLGLVGTALRRSSHLQQRAEQELLEREERLRLFVKYAPVSVAMFDRSMRYLAVSQRWIEEYRLESIQSILGKSHYEVFPNIPDYWRQVHQQALTGQPQKCEDDRFLLPDGTEQYLRWEVQPWLDGDQQVSGILIFVDDITDRKQIELALRDSEQQFRSTFDLAAVGIALVAPDGQWLQVNQKLSQIVGYEEAELLKLTFQEITHADDLNKDLTYVQQMLAGEIQTYAMEKRYLRKDRSIVWIYLTVALVRETNGQPRYFISVIQDINNRKRAQLNEQFLFRLEQQLRQMDDPQVMAWETVQQIGEYLQVDRCSWGRITGQQDVVVLEKVWQRQGVASVLGVYPLAEFFLPDQLHQLQNGETVVVHDVLTNPYTAPFAQNYIPLQVLAYVTVPCLIEGRWGALLHVLETTARQWRSDEITLLQDAVARLWSVIAQTQAIQALRQSEERLRLAIENAPVPFILHAEGGEVLQLNRVWTELSGYSQTDLPTLQVWAERAYEGELQQSAFTERINQLYRIDRRIREGEFRIKTADGRFRFWDFYSAPLGRLEDGRKLIITAAIDTTDRKQSEIDLQQLNATLEQQVEARTVQLTEINHELEAFTYSVSHDLRAPLRIMQGFSQALGEDYGDQLDAIAQSYIDSIAESAVQMDDLINDLLAYSRLSRIQIELSPTELNHVVEVALQQLTAQIQERQAILSVAPNLPCVIAHRPTLVQVVVNLISNAIKFVEAETQPAVSVFATVDQAIEPGWVRLWITDNGIGIAPEHQKRIFRVFERLHGIETYPGTGIGLAIVQKGIERMGGQFGVESHPGKGSRFWIALPLAPPGNS